MKVKNKEETVVPVLLLLLDKEETGFGKVQYKEETGKKVALVLQIQERGDRIEKIPQNISKKKDTFDTLDLRKR